MELFDAENILAGFLIFTRVAGMIMTAPFFSSAAFPARIKLFFALITSVMLFPVIPAQNTELSVESGMVSLAVVILIEVLTGVVLGLVGQLIFAGLEIAGRLISLKIALAFADVVDTMTQDQSTLVSNLFSMLAVLVFLAIDGDKIYIDALVKSYQVVPISEGTVSVAGPAMLDMATWLFVIGVQIASPFLIVLFLLDLSLAIFARIMPQANIMFIALPLKIGTGVILLLLITPYFPAAFELIFQRLFDFLLLIIELMGA